MEPCRDPPLSRAAISSRQLKNDCFYWIVRLIDCLTVRFGCSERMRIEIADASLDSIRFDSIAFQCVSFSSFIHLVSL